MSPKEHFEEFKIMKLEQSRREFNQKYDMIIASNVTKTWGDLKKLTPQPPSISMVGTTPEVSQQITPQPPAGSTTVTKRQWLDSL